MASKSLGTLTLDLVARTGGFVAGMEKAERQSAKWRRQVEKDMKAAGVAIGAASAAAVAGLAYMVKQSINAADEASKLAQAAGVTTEAFTGLQFAAGLSGVSTEELSSALARLNKTSAEVAVGAEKQASLFAALGVSVKDAAGNMRAGNDVLADLADRFQKMPDGVDKAAVAMEIFGRSGTKLIPFLNTGSKGIAELTAQAEKLGLVISDEQAKASEKFNDTLSVLGSVSQGAANKIAAELLPTLNEMSGFLLDVAQDSDAASTAADAFGSVLKAVSVAGIGVATTFANVGRAIGGLAAAAVAAASLEFEQARQIIGMMTADNAKATEDAERRITKLLSGDYADAGRQAAAASGLLRGSTMELAASQRDAAKAAKAGVDVIATQIEALEKQAATLGMNAEALAIYNLEQAKATDAQLLQARVALDVISAYEKQKEQTEAYASLVASLRTEEEQLTDQMRERLAVLDAMQGIEPDERMKVAGRIAGAATQDAPSYGGLDAAIGGPFGELLKIDEAEEKLQEWYATQLEMLEGFRQERADLAAVWDAEELALKQQHEDELARIEQARQMAQLASAESIFGDLAGMARTFAGENSGIYKAMFAVQKAAAIAQSMVAIQTGIALAAANPFPANLAAMASVAAATASIVGNIGAIGLAGQAHDGIMSVPADGTWNLKKGERVTTAETSAKLDKTLSDIQQGGTGAPVVNLYEDASKAGTVNSRQENGQNVIDIFVSDIMGDGKAQKAISRKFGLQGVGA